MTWKNMVRRMISYDMVSLIFGVGDILRYRFFHLWDGNVTYFVQEVT